MAARKVQLRSRDGKMFEVEKAVAFESETIKKMVQDAGADNNNPIRLHSVTSGILAKVIEYCRFHVQAKAENMPEEDIKTRDAELMSIDVDRCTLIQLIAAAGYLNIQTLLQLAGRTLADMFKGKSPHEIAQAFSIHDTPAPAAGQPRCQTFVTNTPAAARQPRSRRGFRIGTPSVTCFTVPSPLRAPRRSS